MSGAEAIAVLGIISSVVAIVDATKQVSNTTGLPRAFGEVAERLPIVQEILRSAEQHIRDDSPDDPSYLNKKPLIDACEKKAKSLKTIFKKVIPDDDASRSERYFRAVRTVGKGGRVETLMEGLMKDVLLLTSEHGMETATSRQVGKLEKAIKELSTLEPSLPDAAFEETAFTNNNFGNGPMTNNNVAGDQKSQVNYGSGKQFLAEIQNFNMGHKRIYQQTYHAQSQQFISLPAVPTPKELQEICEDRVLNELTFRGMDERYEDVDEAHSHTFEWIYARPELKFVHWLKSGNGVFWITGKPGSGKSTLMKFIYEDRRTFDNLPKDIENRSISSFFFHGKGSNSLLKSQEGLFRAILHKILLEHRQLIDIALPKRYERWEREAHRHRHESSTPEWTVKELRAAFRAIVSQSQRQLHLCLLIDGLDEFSGSYSDIIKTLAELIPTGTNSNVRVQLCLSSRPLGEFENAYLKNMHLRVQDLTEDDIKLYVTTKFSEDLQLADLLAEDPTTTNLIIEGILRKAEGVFLWVKLVVDSLVESLSNGDSMRTLQSRLSVLPAGLKPLYRSMIENIRSFYHQESAKVFQMVRLADLPLSPLAMSFAEDNPRDALSHETVFSDAEIAKRHSSITKQLKARTAGLIEVSPIIRDDPIWPIDRQRNARLESKPWAPSQVQYMHLTVKEYLDSAEIPCWLADEISKLLSADIYLRIAACCLRQLRATESLDLYDYDTQCDADTCYHWGTFKEGIVFMILLHARHIERDTRKSMLEYLLSLDKFMTDGRHAGPYKHGHWTVSRYNDWQEPNEWLSDFVSFLVTIGMTYSVSDMFNNHGYSPEAKAGRPLLSYAICNSTPHHSLGPLERDTIDPVMIEKLLSLRCNPNQSFGYFDEDGREIPRRTMWEAALMEVFDRFGEGWARTEDLQLYDQDIKEDLAGMRDLSHRWLRTIELFLRYGANPKQTVTWYCRRRQEGKNVVDRSKTVLSVFNQAFSGCDDPLVSSIRNLMVKSQFRYCFSVVKSRISSRIKISQCIQS